MKTFHGLLVEREDLTDENRNQWFDDIKWEDFKLANNGILVPNDVVVFVDTNGRAKLVKNRFGLTSIDSAN